MENGCSGPVGGMWMVAFTLRCTLFWVVPMNGSKCPESICKAHTK